MRYSDDSPTFFNKLGYGVITGALLPVISFLLYYLFRFGQYPFSEYIRLLIENKRIINVFSLSIFPNLAPFLLFMNTKRYSAGQGVLTSTVLLGIIVFILKFVY